VKTEPQNTKRTLGDDQVFANVVEVLPQSVEEDIASGHGPRLETEHYGPEDIGETKEFGMKGQRKKKPDSSTGAVSDPSTYLSPKDLTDRWRCSRPTVARIAERAGFRRFCLGEGRNGIVRYLRKEVEAYEASRCVQADS